jgi:hypothetical protein
VTRPRIVHAIAADAHLYTVDRWRYGRPRPQYESLYEGASPEYAWGVFRQAVEAMEREHPVAGPAAMCVVTAAEERCGVDIREDGRFWEVEMWPRPCVGGKRYAGGIVPSYVGYPVHVGCGGPVVLGWQAGLDEPAVCVTCGMTVYGERERAAAAAHAEGIEPREVPRGPRRPRRRGPMALAEQLALPIEET